MELSPQQVAASTGETIFFRKNNLVEHLVVIDGIGRSGKGMMAHVLSSFERVEKQRNDEFFEYIPLMHGHGKISEDAACAILRTQADTCQYNNLIGREVNFRASDDTGVFKNADPLRYFKRLFRPAGAAAVERAQKEKPIFQNCVHDTLRYAPILFKAFGDRLKMIYMLRHPVDIIYEWERSGFGHRIGNDPREFQYTFLWKGEVLPHSAKGWQDEYLALSPTDRVIGTVSRDFDLNLGELSKLSEDQRKSIHLVSFESFVSRPQDHCGKIAAFLGTKATRFTPGILKREKCPRHLDAEETKRRSVDLRKKASKKYAAELDQVSQEYTQIVRNLT